MLMDTCGRYTMWTHLWAVPYVGGHLWAVPYVDADTPVGGTLCGNTCGRYPMLVDTCGRYPMQTHLWAVPYADTPVGGYPMWTHLWAVPLCWWTPVGGTLCRHTCGRYPMQTHLWAVPYADTPVGSTFCKHRQGLKLIYVTYLASKIFKVTGGR